MSKIIGIIPARSGSKGLKNKNIKMLNGKPLLAYTIEAALGSSLFDDIVVSTDSQEYADIAVKYGATVPFLRSDSLAKDATSSYDVVVDVIEKMKLLGKEYDYLMLLQPTSPMRNGKDIQKAFELLKKMNANAVVSFCETEHTPVFSGTIPDNLNVDGFIKPGVSFRRQDHPDYFRINGAIYLAKTSYYIENSNIFSSECYAYVMDRDRSVDIDNELDFLLAETIIKYKEN